jgi:hypothetical protein
VAVHVAMIDLVRMLDGSSESRSPNIFRQIYQPGRMSVVTSPVRLVGGRDRRMVQHSSCTSLSLAPTLNGRSHATSASAAPLRRCGFNKDSLHEDGASTSQHNAILANGLQFSITDVQRTYQQTLPLSEDGSTSCKHVSVTPEKEELKGSSQ